MSERRYDPEGTRAAILAAARKTFVQKGVGNTSMTDIAKEAGVTKSLIHHHFGSKEELWGAVKQACFEQYFTTMLEIIRAEGEGEGPMRKAIEYTFDFHRKEPEMTRLLSWMHLDGTTGENELHDEVCREGLARIREAQREGDFRDDVDAAWIQASFLILASGWFQRKWMFDAWDLGPEDDPSDRDERFLRDMMKIFFEGVLPRERKNEGKEQQK